MFILPFAKDNPTRNFPWIVITLIVLNSLIFIATSFAPSTSSVFNIYGFVPARPQAATLFTSMFLHAGFWHLVGNMWFLWMFGNQVENMFGAVLFAIVYLLCGVGGGLLHLALNYGSSIPAVGASGAISGVVGIYFILFPKARFDLEIYFGWVRLKTIPARTRAAVGAWIGEQTLLGLITQATHSIGVAFWAHVGGFAAGAIAALAFVLIVPTKFRRMRLQASPWYSQDRYSRDDNDITRLNLQ